MQTISAAEVIADQRAYLRASNLRRIAVVARAARLQLLDPMSRQSGQIKQETPATIHHEGLTAHHLLTQESEGRCAHCGRTSRQ